jgi:hypothetical protein
MKIKPGIRLKSGVCVTEVVIVRAAEADVDLRCGGVPMRDPGVASDDQASLSPDFAGGSVLGKRYVSEELGIELLCTKSGEGSLSVGEQLLRLKDSKPLPASD